MSGSFENVETRDQETVNGLLRNRIRVIQALRGYRVSEDAVILARFSTPERGDFVLDAGTGCGAIAFAIAVRAPDVCVVGIEIQDALADRAGRGVKLNGLESRVCIVRGDFRHADRLFRAHSFDGVVSNPPYHALGEGRVSKQSERALARHQLRLPLQDLFQVSGRLLTERGKLWFIYPASRFDAVAGAMKVTGFDPARMLWIHSQRGAAAGLVCIEARPRQWVECVTENHLYLYDRVGERSPEAKAILEGEDISVEEFSQS